MKSVRIRFSADQYSPWMISNYIDRFSSLATNLAIAKKLALVLSEGLNPRMISLVHQSRDLWSIGYPTHPNDDIAWFVPLVATNEHGPNEYFFDLLRKLKRPMPVILSDEEINPLIDIYSPDVIKLLTASFNSPGYVTFSLGLGLGELLHEIRFGKKKELREQEKHKHEIRAITLDNQKREQELLAIALDNAERMEKLQRVGRDYVNKIGETMESTIDSLETLNQKADVQSIELE